MASADRPPNPERILEALNGFQRTAVLKAAIALDVFTAIGEGADGIETLARRVDASERGLRALLNYLVTLGLLGQSSGRYTLTRESALFLDRRSPAYLGGTAAFYASPTVVDAFAAVTAAVRRGGSDPERADSMAPGHPLWIDYARGMAPLFARPAEAVAELVVGLRPGARRILDIAAGHGLFGIALARRLPSSVVTALDWPGVLDLARAHAREAGVEDRFLTQEGSAFELPLGSNWDVILLANFIHHFEPRRCEVLLRRVREALADDGVLVLVEFIPNEDRVTPPAAAQMGMTLLATTLHGDVYTFAELVALLGRSGFGPARLHPLPYTPERAVLAHR